MKIAVTFEDGKVFQHFGHTEYFRIYEVNDKQIVNAQTVATNGSGHGALAAFLAERGVEALICRRYRRRRSKRTCRLRHKGVCRRVRRRRRARARAS